MRTQRETYKAESSWFGFAIYGKDRLKVVDRYETRPVVTGNFLRQPVIKYYDFEVFGSLPNAEWLHDNMLMIGNSHERIEWDALLEVAA